MEDEEESLLDRYEDPATFRTYRAEIWRRLEYLGYSIYISEIAAVAHQNDIDEMAAYAEGIHDQRAYSLDHPEDFHPDYNYDKDVDEGEIYNRIENMSRQHGEEVDSLEKERAEYAALKIVAELLGITSRESEDQQFDLNQDEYQQTGGLDDTIPF